MMAAASGEPVVACSVGFEEKSHDELDRARGTAARLGLDSVMLQHPAITTLFPYMPFVRFDEAGLDQGFGEGLALVELAEDEEVDLVILGSHGRSGLSRAFLGSVAERVVRHAPCPVLVVRGRCDNKPKDGE